ncbi:metalloregulator ArsR/SmtB family transcription factor [Elioraea sp.]|uniref:metalloregulator ArsR/SmtB family transcription factor n=1 Tax=Elioraea sp. TaxID=2185103 RepID=UPI0025BBFE88|nr:metalloregulator ArsR/SmtB family transcription factor [Elioraea sp.]
METTEAANILAALAQETRLSLVRLLMAAGPSGLAAGEIAARLGVVPSTLSFHLAALDRAGLIVASRQGRSIRYAARIVAFRALLSFLTETCCAGSPGRCGDLASLLPDIPDPETETMTPDPLIPAFNVLFLCTRNSARSIMAEAILGKHGAGRFRAFSAGSDPAATPLPEVMEKLATLGHDVAGLASKSWDLFTGPGAPRMDFVIALCDTLDNQACPDFGDRAVTGAWPLPDPAKFTGNAAERQTLLNELYASLRRRIEIFMSLPFDTLDRMAAKARLDEIGAGVPRGVNA